MTIIIIYMLQGSNAISSVSRLSFFKLHLFKSKFNECKCRGPAETYVITLIKVCVRKDYAIWIHSFYAFLLTFSAYNPGKSQLSSSQPWIFDKIQCLLDQKFSRDLNVPLVKSQLLIPQIFIVRFNWCA